MRIIGWMITRMILARFFLILIGLSVFVVTLDVVAFAKDILALKNNDLGAIFTYFLLKMPLAISSFLSISTLLAILLTLSELSHRNELPAIWGIGVSPWRIIIALFPLGLILGGVNFLVNDQAIPLVSPTLHEWGIGDYSEKKLRLSENDPLWMRAGNDIIRAADSNPQSTSLRDVTVFRRDDRGLLTEEIIAQKAELIGTRWELANAIVYYRSNLPPHKVGLLVYSGAMKPAAAGSRSGDPEEMTAADLNYFIKNNGFGIRPTFVYSTWWNKRLSLFFSAFVMLALCVPLASRFRREGGIGSFFAIGVGIGFLYFMLDGISLTLGEIGLVPGWMAAWTPVLAFSALATTLVFHVEEL